MYDIKEEPVDWNDNLAQIDAENIKKQFIKQVLIDLLKDMPVQTLQIAYLYAVNYSECGEDVTRAWLTATENSSALEKAYRKGYYDALERNNRMRDFVPQAESEDKK